MSQIPLNIAWLLETLGATMNTKTYKIGLLTNESCSDNYLTLSLYYFTISLFVFMQSFDLSFVIRFLL